MKLNSSFWERICLAGFVAALFQALPAVADDSDSLYLNTTGVSQNQLNIVVFGDHTTDFTATVNPFGASGSVNYSYNAGLGQTTVSFTGPNSVAANASAYAGLAAGHFSDQIAYTYWGTTQPSPPSNLRLPAPSWFITNTNVGLNTQFIILYATVELANGQSVGTWDEQQVPLQPFTVGLDSSDTLDGNQFAFNVGFQFSNTQIPLDDLNFNDYPPPGQTGSMFTPAPGVANDTEIQPFGQVDVSVPEPSTIALFGCGALGFLGIRRHVRTRA